LKPRSREQPAVETLTPAKRELARPELTRAGPLRPALPTRRDAIFRRLLGAADLLAALGGLTVVHAVTSSGLELGSFATAPLIVLIAKITGRYDHDEVVLRKSTLEEVPALMAIVAAYALAWSLATVVFNITADRAGVLVLWAATTTLVVVLRASARAAGRRLAPAERILIIGDAASRDMLAQRLVADPTPHVQIVGFLPMEDERSGSGDRRAARRNRDRRAMTRTIEDLAPRIAEMDVHRVVLIPTNADPEAMLDAIAEATDVGVKVSLVPRLFEVVGSAVEFDHVGGVTVLGIRRPGLSRSSQLAKRAMDVSASALGLIVLAPFGALIALAIKLDSPGPVFFRQPRIGRNGRTFQMIKFRSMVDGAEAQRQALEALNESDGIFKLSRDPRVTRVGRVLRRSSLDELPQLINVFHGEMSLVGPRPLVPEEDQRIGGRHRRRLQLSPGMTGPWQVLGPDRPPLGEMVKLDYLYGTNWSLWSDVKILLRTITHVTGGRGV
jgi:exopolysaccharide biosynthesis polyprenyl glycosylphosphotransferase